MKKKFVPKRFTMEIKAEHGEMFLSALIEAKKEHKKRICILSDRVIVTDGRFALSVPAKNKKKDIFGWFELDDLNEVTSGIRRLRKMYNGTVELIVDDRKLYLKVIDTVRIGIQPTKPDNEKDFEVQILKIVACVGEGTVKPGSARSFDISFLSLYEKIFKRVSTGVHRNKAIVSLWSDADGDRVFVRGEHTYVDGSIPTFVFMPVVV